MYVGTYYLHLGQALTFSSLLRKGISKTEQQDFEQLRRYVCIF
jgi:hypothetical protein